MTAAEFAGRLRLALQPDVWYREAGALRALRNAKWPSGNPVFPDPAQALAAANRAGLIEPHPSYPEDFNLCSKRLQIFLPSHS
jgi:hypothetical protein